MLAQAEKSLAEAEAQILAQAKTLALFQAELLAQAQILTQAEAKILTQADTLAQAELLGLGDGQDDSPVTEDALATPALVNEPSD